MANSFSVVGTTSGSTTDPLIVGDNPTPFGTAILLSPASAFSTGDLASGDVGEFGSCAAFAVEFWFKLQSLQAADGTLFRGPLSSTDGVYQWTLTLMTAGNLVFGATDSGGVTRTATGATSLQADTIYHIVGTAEGGNLNLYLNGTLYATSSAWSGNVVQSLGAIEGSEDMRLFGPASSLGWFYFDEVAVYRAGLTAARVLAHYNAGAHQGFRDQLPGERMIGVLDAASSHAPRSIQTGTRRVIPRYMSGQAPIEECRRAVEAEDVDAALFVTAGGGITFLADGHRSVSPYNTLQASFGDGDSEMGYLGLETDYSETELINEWNVTRSSFGPTPASTQTASDDGSISRYFKRSQSLSDVPTTTDANCAAIASRLLSKYKDPLYRITSISFDTTDPIVTAAVLQRELMDKVRVLRTPPGGGARIQQDVWIQQIDISGGNDGKPWSIRWAVSPL